MHAVGHVDGGSGDGPRHQRQSAAALGVREAELGRGAERLQPLAVSKPAAKTAAPFVALQLPAPGSTPAIRIELRRGATAINVSWPAEAADACMAWMRELLR